MVSNTEEVYTDEEVNPVQEGTWTHLTFVDLSGEKIQYFKPTIKLDNRIEFSIWKIKKKAFEMDPYQINEY